MLTELSLSGFLAFAAAYPLCFWSNAGATIDRGFYRFNLGVSCFILSLGLFALLFAAPDAAAGARVVLFPVVEDAGPLARAASTLQRGTALLRLGGAGPLRAVPAVLAVVWLAGLLAVTWSQWERPRPSLPLVTLPSLLGFVVTAAATVARTPPAAAPLGAAAVTLLGGLTLGMALYSMVLGHWYLSVARLPIAILARAVAVYSVLLALRLVWDAVAFATQSLPYQGLPLPLYAFVGTLDGFLVAVAVFFGTLFPLAANWLVQRTLAAKSTQAATGILYVVVVAAIIGDFSYRFFLLRYGAVL